MLDSAPSHPKMKRLSRELRIPLAWAVGIMQMLWIYTKEHFADGQLKADNIDIEEAVGWPVERSGELVPALIAARWLDETDSQWLLVHDWSTHCPPYVHTKLFRDRRLFADGSVPKCRPQDLKESERGKYVDWVKNGPVDNCPKSSGRPVDNMRKSTGLSQKTSGDLIGLDLIGFDSNRSVGVQDLQDSDKGPDEPPPPKTTPPTKSPTPKPPNPNGLRRVTRDDLPATVRDPLASVLRSFAPRLPDPESDAQLLRTIASELDRAGMRPEDLAAILKPKREALRQAKGWGLIIAVIETACRGKPLGPRRHPAGRILHPGEPGYDQATPIWSA